MRLRTGQADLAGIVRAFDTEGIAIGQLQLHQPSLDDVFLAKTGRSLEGADDERTRRGRRRRPRDGAAPDDATADQVYLLGRRSVVRTLRQPANVIAPLIFPLMLLAVNAGGLKAETHLPGFPTGSMVSFLLAVPFIQGALFATMNTGTDFARDIQTGFLSRLSLTPMRGAALLLGQLGGTVSLGLFQAVIYIAVGFAWACASPRARSACLSCSFLRRSSSSPSARSALVRGAANGLRRGSAGLFPVFFVFLFLSSMAIPRNLMTSTGSATRRPRTRSRT